MPAPLTRDHLEAFYRACISRDPARIELFLDDDVEWMLAGPVDVLWYCGVRKGKAAAIEMMVRGREVIELKRFEFDDILIAGDHAATFSWFVGVQPKTGREVRFRCAHFLRFRDGKVTLFRTVRDTFRFVEQLIGHPLDLGDESVHPDNPVNGHNGHAAVSA